MKTSALGWPCRADPNIRVNNAATGEPLRQFVLNPDRDYQPPDAPAGPFPGTPRPALRQNQNPNLMWVRGHSDVWRHHECRAGRIRTGDLRDPNAAR
jgi:hypothetical protein